MQIPYVIQDFFSRLVGTKTFWAAACGTLTAIGGWVTGKLSGETAIELAFLAALSLFVRDGIAKHDEDCIILGPDEWLAASDPAAEGFETFGGVTSGFGEVEPPPPDDGE